MKKPIILLFFLCLFMFVSHVGSVQAVDDDAKVNLGDLPQKLAEALNIDLFVGQLIVSALFISFFLFPSMMIAGYWGGSGAVLYTVIIVGLTTSGICVALTWLPVWLYFVMCMLIALLFAGTMRSWITGGPSRGD